MSIILAALLLAGPQISYAEDFTHRSAVDLSQGFYVCQPSTDPMVVDQLLSRQDIDERRNLATRLGCRFKIHPHRPQPAWINDVLVDRCLDREVTSDAVLCGREGHLLRVTFGKRSTIAVWISMDQDFD